MKGYTRYGQSTIHLPRQEFLFCLILLIICEFSQSRRVHYNDFTTFEKCSDMATISIKKVK